MVDGRWVRLGTIREVSPTQEVTSGCRVPSRPLFATRTTHVASRLLPTHPPLHIPPETVNHPHGESSADLQNAAACRDRLPTVCDSYVRNRYVLTGCDLVIEMLNRGIRKICWKTKENREHRSEHRWITRIIYALEMTRLYIIRIFPQKELDTLISINLE